MGSVLVCPREERTPARATVVDLSSAMSLLRPGSCLELSVGASAVVELATLESTQRSLTLLNGSQKQWPPTKLQRRATYLYFVFWQNNFKPLFVKKKKKKKKKKK